MRFLTVTAWLTLACATTPAEDDTRALFANAVPELLEANGIPGAAIALVRDGELVWADGFGLADESTVQVGQPRRLELRLAGLRDRRPGAR